MGIFDKLKGKKKKQAEKESGKESENADKLKEKGTEKDTGSKAKEKSRRSRRDYVGEPPEEVEPEQKTGEPKEKKPEKSTKLYHCSLCTFTHDTEENLSEGAVFENPEEFVSHLYDEHGVSSIPEDAEPCAIQVPKEKAKELLAGMKRRKDEEEKESKLAEKRMQKTISVPKELEPKNIVDLRLVNSPDEVYDKTIATMTGSGQQPPESDECYTETVTGNIIEVSMVKRLPKTAEIMAALNTIKMA